MSEYPYLHGFSKVEVERLRSQARFAEHIVYQDIDLSTARHILEVGCGVGAQTDILLRRFPEASITGVDKSSSQIAEARDLLSDHLHARGRYDLHEMDAAKLTFEDHTFDGAFVCWLLEHVPNPVQVLKEIRRTLKPQAPVYITEVMNSSFHLDPYSPQTWKYWQAFNDFQIDTGGDPFIGAKLGNLLADAGFDNIALKEKVWHFDNRQPAKRAAILKFWCELLLSAAGQLIQEGRVTPETVSGMKSELDTVIRESNSVFYYSFIQGVAST